MKNTIYQLIVQASQQAVANGDFPLVPDLPRFAVERPKEEKHGDFSTNLAMVLAPRLSMNPRVIAEKIIKNINGESRSSIKSLEIAGPGFINFFMTNGFWCEKLREAVKEGDDYGRTDMGKGEKVLVEFVSANPTGPLHVGHGRGAVVGDVTANVLDRAGYDVQKEYYINDVGLQMKTLGLSTFVRYKQLLGRDSELPENSYKGEYIKEIAQRIIDEKGERYLDIPEDEAVSFCSEYSSGLILSIIKADLKDFGISFDNWYSEKSLYEPGEDGKNRVEGIIEWMQKKDYVYEKEDALWLRASAFGDEKDRVVQRGNGVYTYFASDIAYHREKFARGFQKIIDVWGADHHGYVPRLRSAIEALNFPQESFLPILVQLVNLKQGKEIISMSTRGGKFRRLSELVADVGKDAARFFFLLRGADSQFDFDVDLAKSQSSENPVYYVQYAHARICSVFKHAAETPDVVPDPDPRDLELLSSPEELGLIKKMLVFPDLVNRMALRLEPHLLTHYLLELASAFHRFYYKHRVITDDGRLTAARLYLVQGVKITLKNSLDVLGVTAPESM